MAISLVRGTTSKRRRIFIQDTTVTTGAGLTGLVYNSSGLTWYYIREDQGASVQVTMITMTLGTWASGGFVEVDATHMPGLYEIGIPNAAISGGASVQLHLQGATNMVPVILDIELTGWDNQNATSGGIGNLDAAVTTRLAPTVASRTLDVAATGEAGLDFDNIKDASGSHTLTNIRVPNVTLTDTVTTYTGNTLQTGDSFARLGLPAGASVSADIAEIEGETDDIATVLTNTTTILSRLGSFTGSTVNTVLGFFQALFRNDSTLPSDIGGTYTNMTMSLQGMYTKIIHIPEGLPMGVAYSNFKFIMRSSSTHIDPTAGLTITAQRSIDTGAFAACTNAVVEISNGAYRIDLSASDLNGTSILLYFTASGADPAFYVIKTV